MKCNQSRPGFELVSPCPFPTTITITPRAPPKRLQVLLSNTDSFICTQLNGFRYCYLILTIQFNISLHTVKWLNSSIWPIDWTLTGATPLVKSGPGSNGNEGVPRILQNWSFTVRLFSVLSRTLVGVGLTHQQRCSWRTPQSQLTGMLIAGRMSYPSAEVQLAYFTAPADSVRRVGWSCNYL